MRIGLRIVLGILALSLAIFSIWILTLPSPSAASTLDAIPQAESAAALAGLKPPKRSRPLVAIVGINDSTELTDYLMPYGILRRADVADVVALGTQPGPVTLYPAALAVEPEGTIAVFDARHPDGADYVIVPQMSRDDDPVVLQWLQEQAEKGATVVGVCAGATIVANAGVLDAKRATTHWYYLDELRGHSEVRYVPDRRFVVDEGVATTTGISASMPFTLTLIEAIAGRQKAQAVAQDLGVKQWDARHDSEAFLFTRPFAVTALGNRLAFWNHEELGIEIEPGIDEVTLALVADAWSRTYRSRAVTFAASAGPQRSRGGIAILPDRVAASWPADRLIPAVGDRQPATALQEALDGIAARYGARTSDFVAMQLEYPRRP
jgi:putative intracellular protease/amidase